MLLNSNICLSKLKNTNIRLLFNLKYFSFNTYFKNSIIIDCVLYCLLGRQHGNIQLITLLTCHSTLHVINLSFHQLAISSTCDFINLHSEQDAISPFCYFCQCTISSTCHFINLPFHQLTISSMSNFINE